MRVGPDLCDVSWLYETADLFYDADEPSRSMAGRAVWLHDYLRDTMPATFMVPMGSGSYARCSA